MREVKELVSKIRDRRFGVSLDRENRRLKYLGELISIYRESGNLSIEFIKKSIFKIK